MTTVAMILAPPRRAHWEGSLGGAFVGEEVNPDGV